MIRPVMTFLGRGPDRDFVLLALPKTASTSLERALTPYATEVVGSPPGRKHLPARGFVHTKAHELAEQGHPRESYELVAMFREPIAWLESWWRYRAREDSRQSTADMTFEEFALHYLAGHDDAPVPKGRPARFIHARVRSPSTGSSPSTGPMSGRRGSASGSAGRWTSSGATPPPPSTGSSASPPARRWRPTSRRSTTCGAGSRPRASGRAPAAPGCRTSTARQVLAVSRRCSRRP